MSWYMWVLLVPASPFALWFILKLIGFFLWSFEEKITKRLASFVSGLSVLLQICVAAWYVAIAITRKLFFPALVVVVVALLV